MNLEGGQFFCPTEGKVPCEDPGYCYQRAFYLEVVVVMMLIHPCCSLSGAVFENNKDEDKFNFIFNLGAGISY